MNINDVRKREYKMLYSKLKSRRMRLERDLFTATFRAIVDMEYNELAKHKAIKKHAKTVTQTSVKRTLEDIEYLTPEQRRQEFKPFAIKEANELDHILAYKRG